MEQNLVYFHGLTMAIMIVAIIIQLFIYFSLVTQTFPIQLLEVLQVKVMMLYQVLILAVQILNFHQMILIRFSLIQIMIVIVWYQEHQYKTPPVKRVLSILLNLTILILLIQPLLGISPKLLMQPTVKIYNYQIYLTRDLEVGSLLILMDQEWQQQCLKVFI